MSCMFHVCKFLKDVVTNNQLILICDLLFRCDKEGEDKADTVLQVQIYTRPTSFICNANCTRFLQRTAIWMLPLEEPISDAQRSYLFGMGGPSGDT